MYVIILGKGMMGLTEQQCHVAGGKMSTTDSRKKQIRVLFCVHIFL